MIYSQSVFPMPQLNELREKYTYNITPFSSAMSTGRRPKAPMFNDDDEIDDDDLVDNINCFTGIFVPNQAAISPSKTKPLGEKKFSGTVHLVPKKIMVKNIYHANGNPYNTTQ